MWLTLGCGRLRVNTPLYLRRASFVVQLVKNPPAMRETWVWSLGWEDPLDKEKVTHSVFWPGEFQGLYSSWGCKESDTTEQLSLSLLLVLITVMMALLLMEAWLSPWWWWMVEITGKWENLTCACVQFRWCVTQLAVSYSLRLHGL